MKIFHIIISYRFSFLFRVISFNPCSIFQHFRFFAFSLPAYPFYKKSSESFSYTQQRKRANLLFRKWHYPFSLYSTQQPKSTKCLVRYLFAFLLQHKLRPKASWQDGKRFSLGFLDAWENIYLDSFLPSFLQSLEFFLFYQIGLISFAPNLLMFINRNQFSLKN